MNLLEVSVVSLKKFYTVIPRDKSHFEYIFLVFLLLKSPKRYYLNKVAQQNINSEQIED